MTTDEDLRYDVSDRIAEISLARPPVNALSLALLEQLSWRCGEPRPTRTSAPSC